MSDFDIGDMLDFFTKGEKKIRVLVVDDDGMHELEHGGEDGE